MKTGGLRIMEDREKDSKYDDLEQLSTDELEDLLRTDTDQPDGPGIDLVLRVTEILLERKEGENGKPVIDVERAWKEFRQYFNTSDADGRALYPVDEAEAVQ